jgi:N-acetylglucosaminyldiphosphoundecaprenol N-acetyl-beta-D-mannosaminyltransferase
VRHTILGVQLDLVDYGQVLEAIESWRKLDENTYVTLTPPHSVLMCQRDQGMREATSRARLSLPDGVGIVWASAILGYPHKGRVTGPALMLHLCDKGRALGYRHYFYGGDSGVPERLARRLEDRFPGLQIAGMYSPPFRSLSADEDAADTARINAASPDIVWVGLGAPKQEKWMAAHMGRIQATAMIGVGAAFDYHAGRVPWAPRWVRAAGLEWAYRFAHEPRRLWRRNLDSPLFLAKVLLQRIGIDSAPVG